MVVVIGAFGVFLKAVHGYHAAANGKNSPPPSFPVFNSS